jgi:hypothetical protein
VEARGQGPEGEILEGTKAKRGTTRGHRVTPARGERTFRMHQSLKSGVALFRCGATTRGAKRVARRGGYRKGKSSEGRSPRALPA